MATDSLAMIDSSHLTMGSVHLAFAKVDCIADIAILNLPRMTASGGTAQALRG